MSGPNRDGGSNLSELAHSESSEAVVARYDGWAAIYDDDLASWGYTVPEALAAALVERFAETATPLDTVSVLDAGCGTGLIGRAMQHHGIESIDGIDASVESLSKAADSGVYRNLTAIDLSAPLPLRDASYDAVVCGGVLTYLQDVETVLGEFLRVTAPSGWVIATQRTDLWEERDCDAVIERLCTMGGCTAEVGEPQPYLPGHDEYAAEILVKTITLQRR